MLRISISFDGGSCSMCGIEGKYLYLKNSSRGIKENQRLNELVKWEQNGSSDKTSDIGYYHMDRINLAYN